MVPARRTRIEFGGARYEVMALENRCQWIFASLDEGEEVLISESLADGRERSGFRILGWALSPEIPGE